MSNAHLPDEIISDILSRLPVKSLLQFMSVSKDFRGLISDTHFIKSHLEKAESLSTHHRILIPASPLISLNYNLPLNDTNVSMKLSCPFLNPRYMIKILGSCSGLVCLINGTQDLIIYNPATRIHFKPFQSPKQVCSGSNESNQIEYVSGFGYGSNPSDLRVVRFPRFGRDSEHARYDFIDTAGTFLNGSLHWLARHSNIESQNRVIASFDVSKDAFTDVSLPPQKPYLPYYMLGVLKGCLYALRDGVHYEYTEVEVWLMKEYGVVNSWSKFVKIPVDIWTGDISYMRPLRCVNDDEVLVEIDLQSHAIYDTKWRTFRRVRGVGDLKWYGDASVYVESLVSPQVSCILY